METVLRLLGLDGGYRASPSPRVGFRAGEHVRREQVGARVCMCSVPPSVHVGIIYLSIYLGILALLLTFKHCQELKGWGMDRPVSFLSLNSRVE